MDRVVAAFSIGWDGLTSLPGGKAIGCSGRGAGGPMSPG